MSEPALDALPSEASPPHPEEMKGSFAIRIGDRTMLQASGRTTPAGLISAGLAVAAILVACGVLVRAAKAGPRLRRR